MSETAASGPILTGQETAEPYDPIPDLARLLAVAMRQGHPLPGLEFTLSHLWQGLELPGLAYSDEAEAAIRKALAALDGSRENER